MAGFRVSGEIGNLKDVIDELRARKKKINPVLRRAVNKAAQRLAKGMKSRVKSFRETGLLDKSLGYRVKVYGDGRVMAIIGPRRGFKQTVVLLGGKGALAKSKAGQRLASKGGKETVRNPTRYAHLTERKYGWMRATIDQDGPAAVADMQAVLEAEIWKG